MDNFPTKEELQDFIKNSSKPMSKRDITRAFKIKGRNRILMKETLHEMVEEGWIERTRSKTYGPLKALPGVMTVEITGHDEDGEITAKPAEWHSDKKPPMIYMKPEKRGHSLMEEGDHLLVRLRRLNDTTYEGKVLKNLEEPAGQIIGIFKPVKGGGYIYPTDKKVKDDFFISGDFINGAQEGDLVVGQMLMRSAQRGRHHKTAKVIEILGNADDPKLISKIAIAAHGLPHEFSNDVIKETKNLKVPELKKRENLRDIPLVTIDGEDARDFDDAVFAELDTAKSNEGGYHLIVAIADVSHYVRAGSSLDREAFKRGNSTYFPDRVVPMLPEALSNDLCSLRPHEDRACLATHMWIDKQGKLLKHKFVRGIMRSHARLIYEQVQAAYDGQTDDITEHLVEPVLNPLYDAFKILDTARQKRGALEIDLPERKPIIDDKGQVTNIVKRDRLDSHKLVEEFMILANVATAEALESKNSECVYRVHDKPDPTKIEAAGDFVSQLGYSITKGQTMTPSLMNGIIKKSVGSDEHDLINTLVLRCQCRAIYSPTNIGHFGLALDRYAHFTSPIRRYADLIVHRALVKAFNLGEGPLSEEEIARIDEISNHISETERHSMVAERDATDRFTALYLSENIGNEFAGRINSVTNFGLFVTLDESGADGIVPMRSLPDDYYIHDEDQHALIGERHGRVYRLSAPVTISLVEADPLKGSMVFKVLNKDGADIPGFKKKPLKRQQRNGPRRSGKNRKDGKAPHFKRNKKKNIKKKSST